ncbi:hypothetical protein V8C86DRAFT_3032555 [Haematococcus lacustris]
MDASCMAEVTGTLGEKAASSSTSTWRTAAAAVGELLEQQAGPLNIAAVPAAAAEALQEVMTGKGCLVQYIEPCTREHGKELPLPHGKELDSLRQEDAALVNQHWTYSSAGSLGLVQQMIASYPSSCIRLPAATLTLQPGAEPEARSLDPGSTRRDSPSSSCTQLTEDMQSPSLRGTQASTSLVSSQRKNQVHDAQVSPAAAQRQRPCNDTDEGDKEVEEEKGAQEEAAEQEEELTRGRKRRRR